MSFQAERELLGALLKGGGRLFGARVELSWPDGLPYPEEELRSIGENWAPHDGPEWVRADVEFCHVAVPCGRELDSSHSCGRHGFQAAQASGEAVHTS